MLTPFIHLKVHSAYSLAESAIRISDMVAYCKKHQMPAIALTDTHNMFGAMEFSLALAKEGIQPILGIKLSVIGSPSDPDKKPQLNAETLIDYVTVIAATRQGYQNMTKLISRAYLAHGAEKIPYVTPQQLFDLSDGLIVLMGTQSALGRGILHGHLDFAQNILLEYHKVFQDRLYVEVSRVGESHELWSEDRFIGLAHQHSVPLVATNEAFFVHEDQHQAHDALLCIANGAYVTQDDRPKVTRHQRLKTPDEMVALFADLPEALENTLVIARRCDFFLEPVTPMLPPFPCDKGEGEELKNQAFEGLKMRLETQVLPGITDEAEKKATIQIYEDRLNFEIGIIGRMGYSGYYLIVADFIKWAKSQDIPVGPGRGSGAGSLVAWSLTITDVDPIALNLLFERFLNPERISMPDFDIDFCQDRRDEVIEYVCQKYGHDRVAQIITFGKLQARAVLRDVGRVLGMSYNQVDGICKLIPNNPTSPVTLAEAFAQDPALQLQCREEQGVQKLYDIGIQLEGLYRHASTHAAGVVIGGEPLENIVPLYHDGVSPLPATQFNMKYVELAGLVKFDFLGLRTLTVIQRAIELLKDRDIHINISQIPLNDETTFHMLQRLETFGVFQLDGAGMRDVLRKLHPNRFEELVALVALYRPGPMDDIPRYLACKHGQEEITYAHPMLEEILSETFGVMVYQEQVMQIAQTLAGYSLGQADLLRRAMGKKIKSEMDAQQAIFLEGCEKNNIPKQAASQIFDQMAKFASYGFNKCHSAPYALITYQTAFVKANYPVEFMAAQMTYDMQNTDKLNMGREEMNRLHIPLLPPDINASHPDFSVEKVADDKLGVRYALAAIKNVGRASMEAVVEERTLNGPYKDIVDFSRRLDPKHLNRRALEHLIAAGTFDLLHGNRAQLMNNLDLILRYAGEKHRQKDTRQQSLFGSSQDMTDTKIELAPSQPWTASERGQQEFDAIGFYLSEHPLEAFKDFLTSMKVRTYQSLTSEAIGSEGATYTLAGVVMSKKERISPKSGQKYAFVQLSDFTGMFEGVVFSDVYQASRALIEEGTKVLVRANVRADGESLRLIIQSIQALDEAPVMSSGTLRIQVSDARSLPALKDLFQISGMGTTRVELEVQTTPHVCKIALKSRYNITPKSLESLELIPHLTHWEVLAA